MRQNQPTKLYRPGLYQAYYGASDAKALPQPAEAAILKVNLRTRRCEHNQFDVEQDICAIMQKEFKHCVFLTGMAVSAQECRSKQSKLNEIMYLSDVPRHRTLYWDIIL